MFQLVIEELATEETVNKIFEILHPFGVSRELAEIVGQSGYIPWRMRNPFSTEIHTVIMDTMYGNKECSGFLNLQSFSKYLLSGDTVPRPRLPRYRANSWGEIKEILELPQNRVYFERGRMCFRGQPREYYIERRIPNPVQSVLHGGLEPSLLPSFYRDSANRPSYRAQWRNTLYLDSILYHGLDILEISKRNHEKDLFHSMSDLEHFDDAESREVYRRWNLKLHPMTESYLNIIYQHYIDKTTGLDVTFNPEIATWFATNTYNSSGDMAYYSPINNTYNPLIYCIVYESPGLLKSSDMITDIPLFDHCYPERVLRQQCCLVGVDPYGLNQAVSDLHCIIELSPEGKYELETNFDQLFPSPEQDNMYKLLLEKRPFFSEEVRAVHYRH